MKERIFSVFPISIVLVTATAQDEVSSNQEVWLYMLVLLAATFALIFLVLYLVKKFVRISPDVKGEDGWTSGGTYEGGQVSGASAKW